jgi:hypothetical protein
LRSSNGHVRPAVGQREKMPVQRAVVKFFLQRRITGASRSRDEEFIAVTLNFSREVF